MARLQIYHVTKRHANRHAIMPRLTACPVPSRAPRLAVKTAICPRLTVVLIFDILDSITRYYYSTIRVLLNTRTRVYYWRRVLLDIPILEFIVRGEYYSILVLDIPFQGSSPPATASLRNSKRWNHRKFELRPQKFALLCVLYDSAGRRTSILRRRRRNEEERRADERR